MFVDIHYKYLSIICITFEDMPFSNMSFFIQPHSRCFWGSREPFGRLEMKNPKMFLLKRNKCMQTPLLTFLRDMANGVHTTGMHAGTSTDFANVSNVDRIYPDQLSRAV